ncbi:MAG: hypothetical protein E6H08_16550 [Bacteroidetes bacterium]|nr:MAG: hypothetical protein E6H08_16550 [Bacteroidota bacterium]
MKKLILSLILSIALLSLKAQQDTIKKEYLIKYEVLTKKGEKILVNYFDKNETNAGATASESWFYTFTTTNKTQNIQVSTVGGKSANSNKGAKVWVKINIYVNGNLIKSAEEKVLGLGPTVQVSLQDIK